jgi:prephenate dehydratase
MFRQLVMPLGSSRTTQKAHQYRVGFARTCTTQGLSQKVSKIPKVTTNFSSFNAIDNTTRFFILSARSSPPRNTTRTFLRFMVDHTQPGALCNVLQAFKHYNLNLTSIASRPAVHADRLWTYVFFVEFEGHEEDQAVQDVVSEMRIIARDLRVLGSYETHPLIPPSS